MYEAMQSESNPPVETHQLFRTIVLDHTAARPPIPDSCPPDRSTPYTDLSLTTVTYCDKQISLLKRMS